ncbi:hypothetical protein PIROE2DRAFT_13448 [Piromyces sp. E2]|nr:hypothetical protein PIROE2DRAFT_13448 [Piromyces sp. E2]|eukprot:OUM60719.1 hypothetical protein PIROE2DRAFT_13448 [Piromyces sp. E2]
MVIDYVLLYGSVTVACTAAAGSGIGIVSGIHDPVAIAGCVASLSSVTVSY